MKYRVWPDGTAQSCEEEEPYPWKSDDFAVVEGDNEEDAVDFYRSLWEYRGSKPPTGGCTQ